MLELEIHKKQLDDAPSHLVTDLVERWWWWWWETVRKRWHQGLPIISTMYSLLILSAPISSLHHLWVKVVKKALFSVLEISSFFKFFGRPKCGGVRGPTLRTFYNFWFNFISLWIIIRYVYKNREMLEQLINKQHAKSLMIKRSPLGTYNNY